MNLRRNLSGALIAAAAVAALAVPAGAAVPTRPPQGGLQCDSVVTRLWFDAKHVAADNAGCSSWYIIRYAGVTIDVAPGAHFNVNLATLGQPDATSELYLQQLSDSWGCGDFVFWRNSHGRPKVPACH